jgi:MFS family permease
MRDSFAAPPWVDTLTLPFFLVAQSLGRLSGDRLVMRFGVTTVAKTLTATALVGLLLVIFAPALEIALAGFLLIGLGVCVSFPLTTSAAARLGDRPSSQNVASLTLGTQIVLLGAPAVLGFVAQRYGVRITFASTLPFIIASVWLARFVAPQPTTRGLLPT